MGGPGTACAVGRPPFHPVSYRPDGLPVTRSAAISSCLVSYYLPHKPPRLLLLSLYNPHALRLGCLLQIVPSVSPPPRLPSPPPQSCLRRGPW